MKLTYLACFLTLAASASGQTLERFNLPGTLAGPSGLGTQVATLGDVNGDGIQDFVVSGAQQHLPVLIGEMKVYSGDNGALLYQAVLGGGSESFAGNLSVVGDINGDGVDDFGVAGLDAAIGGFVRIFSGANGAVLFSVFKDSTMFPQGNGVSFGESLGSSGDISGDGVPDLWIGAPRESAGFAFDGLVYAHSGADGTPLFRTEKPASSDRFGAQVVGVDDFDGDGVRDVAIGAPQTSGPSAQGSGAVYIMSGITGQTLAARYGQVAQALGSNLLPMGDLNGDGFTDLLVLTTTVPATGVRIAFVEALSLRGGIQALWSASFGTDASFDSAAEVGDTNQDGVSDFVCTAGIGAGVLPGSGKAYLISGSDGGVLGLQEADRPETLVVSVAGLGDIDGNGIPDWVVGSVSSVGLDESGLIQAMQSGCVATSVASCTAPVNSTGVAGSLETVACGTQLNDGRMQLRIRDLPANQFGFLFMGDQAGSTQLGSIILCMSGQITPLDALSSGFGKSDGLGYVNRLIDWGTFAAGSTVLPGTTFHFQWIHRDPGLASGMQVTNAVSVPF